MPRRSSNSITRHARANRAALTAIGRSLGSLVAGTTATGKSVERLPRKRVLNLSPKRLAQLESPGQCIGYVRNLSPRRNAQVGAVKARKGVREAIAAATRMAASWQHAATLPGLCLIDPVSGKAAGWRQKADSASPEPRQIKRCWQFAA